MYYILLNEDALLGLRYDEILLGLRYDEILLGLRYDEILLGLLSEDERLNDGLDEYKLLSNGVRG